VQRLQGLGYSPDHFITSLTIATAVLLPIAFLLLPFYVALVGGDLVAKEAEDGTLRMILSRPISRWRLVTVKWVAGAIFSVLLALVLGVAAVFFASIFFPAGGLFALLPGGIFSIFESAEGWQRFAIATLAISGKAITLMGLAWMFSCFNIKPAAATILALSIDMTSRIVQEIPYFHDLQTWFLTYHLDFWIKMFQKPIPWWSIGESFSILLGYNLTFYIIGCSIFHVRDIKS